MSLLEKWAFTPRVERRLFNMLHAVGAGTGAAYFYMKYLMTTDDPFALVNHRWQSAMLSSHVVAVPWLILCCGMVFRSHVLWKIRLSAPGNRRTGWLSMLGFLAMALSGYLIQVASSPTLVTVFIWAHVGASTLFVVTYGFHLAVGYRLDARRRREPVPTSGIVPSWLLRARVSVPGLEPGHVPRDAVLARGGQTGLGQSCGGEDHDPADSSVPGR